jgi:cytochrome c oxidase assembly protein subunit 15
MNTARNNRPVIIWLLTGCLLIFIMVVVGGITRLTNSGLSMTDWHLVTDTFPPMSEEKWQHAFEEYQKYPEYKLINSQKDFTLDDYKFIYFWEWFHRFIGRIIGLVFVIPFVYFLIRKKLDGATIRKCLVLFGLGALQAFFGWYMVKSGLIDNPDVSHFRLSLHLITAFLTFACTLWVALDLMFPGRKPALKSLKPIMLWTMAVLLIQIVYGGFVAGLNAGLIHNHWPLMSDGQFIHDSVFLERETVAAALTEGKSGVQFVHRMIAYVVAGMVVAAFAKSRKVELDTLQRSGFNWMLGLVILQFGLGVFTLLLGVPLWLGLAHQVGAFFLLTGVTFVLHRVSK